MDETSEISNVLNFNITLCIDVQLKLHYINMTLYISLKNGLI